MPGRRVLPATTAVLAACFTFAACDASRQGADADTAPAVLRTYHVPVEHQNEVHTALRTALGITTDNPFGRVSLGPGGTLIVVAPERIQAGIEQIVNADLGAPPAGGDTASIRLTYSIVVGRPLASTAEPFVVRGRSSPRLDTVLAQIAEAQGPTEFAVLEELSVTSTADQAATQVTGRVVRVSHQASRRGDRIVADVQLAHAPAPGPMVIGSTPPGPSMLNTRISLRNGQVLVLGQSGYQRPTREAFPDAAQTDASATLYYVVAADSL